jgi:hypothetical protein
VKYFAALIAGVLAGGTAAVLFVLVNPLTSPPALSPLAVSQNPLMLLKYSGVPADAILVTNDGESRVRPSPSGVAQLWEPAIEHSSIAVVPLTDVRGEQVGLGIKFSSLSESTRLLSGQANVDSAWHVFLPGKGSFFVGQRENYFDFLRQVVLPAEWGQGKNWKGQWRQNVTSGPGMLGTATVTGGSGMFDGLVADGIETHAARAYSARIGPVALEGELAIEMRAQPTAELAAGSR